MADGYWTPWHLAVAEVDALLRAHQEREAELRDQLKEAREDIHVWETTVDQLRARDQALREKLISDEFRLYHQSGCELRRYGTEQVKEQQHVCGLSGFGALGDVCPACEGPFTYRPSQCTCKLGELHT
jgi:hypothetical protein